MADIEIPQVVITGSRNKHGSISWEMPESVWTLTQALPADVKAEITKLVEKVLSFCVTAMSVDLQYSVPKLSYSAPEDKPLVSFSITMATVLSDMQRKIAEEDPLPKNKLN